jgi:hypothetical protein
VKPRDFPGGSEPENTMRLPDNEIIKHDFVLTTSSGNRLVQPVVFVREGAGFKIHHVPGKWTLSPSEADRREWAEWVEPSANLVYAMMGGLRAREGGR